MTSWTPQSAVLPQPYRVLLQRGDFIDHARAGRVVPYKIFYPADGAQAEKFPVILWSHGFGGNKDGASFISRFLASQGYVIVHFTHEGTDSSLWEGKPGHPWDILKQVKVSRETTLNRMYDVPFVLDCLYENAFESDELFKIMDFNRIGMSGHSFGAMTTQVMAGMLFPNKDRVLTDLYDPRIKAGILYSPVPIGHLTEASPADVYSTIRIPLLHMTGTEDDSPIENYNYEHRLIVSTHANHPEQYVHILPKGDHMIYNGTRGKLGENPLREQHEQEILDVAFAFWQAYLKNDADAKLWLQTYRKKV